MLLALLLGALVLFASEKVRADLVALGLLLALMLTGIVNTTEGFSGFASPAVITVVCMFILSGGLVRTGVADEMAGWVIASGVRGTLGLTAIVMLLVGTMSSFMNNIAAVTILMPTIFAIAQRTGVPVTKLLIPLSFGSLLGGLSTLVGTPPNLLASEALMRAGYQPFRMFDFLPTGLAVFLCGFIYFLVIGSRLVPVRTPAGNPDDSAGMRHYVTEAIVPRGSALVGRSQEQARLRETLGVAVLRIHRQYDATRNESPTDRPWLRYGRYGRDEGDGSYSFLPWPEAVFLEGDHLQLEGDPSALLQKQGRGLLEIPEAEGQRDERQLIGEVALSPGSRSLGISVAEADFPARYGVTVLGLRRNGRQEDERINQLRLETGDVLLVRGPSSALAELGHNPDFLVVNRLDRSPRDHRRRWAAIAIMAATVLAAASGVVHISVAALAGVLAMVGSGCMPMRDMYAQVDWRVIFMIAALMPLSVAMDAEHTGAAQWIAEALVSLAGSGSAYIAMLMVIALTIALTQVMSNAACVVLVAPIAIQMAEGLGVAPQGFAMAVAIAASTAFITPVGHQANMLVYGVGNYRFNDFVKVGGPLSLLVLITTLLVVPWVWPMR
ncbi:SLC13 family permease [Pseudomarimonas salicorniae]|uniref:SLC13 family permease n=1 Tax=Pseudomarimonas salicorniae TaxID=2933270 RepID=A0ABT0GCA0_9GAMM|nr:SLC13 family permease [Lysobacter sp. CAU 1642]MCK7592165.1 SLC13 family permease [Lysobacter sp. CAU 1642]